MKNALEVILNGQLDGYLSEHQKVIVVFFSDTCNKCHFWMNNLIDLADEYDEDGDPFVVAYNAGEDVELCNKLNLASVPMLVAFENGEEIGRIDEVQTNDFIKDYFKWNDGDNLSVRVQVESNEA